MLKKVIKMALLWGGIASVVAILLVIFVYRPWAINWGATDAEINRTMPGDEIVQNPLFNATRAVTINAQPEEIWPWIIQMGYKRAGFYSYDKLDNDGIPSANHIIPEYQNLKVGDLIPLSASSNAEVAELLPNRSMVWVFQDCGPWSNNTWAWELYQTDEAHTRMLTRLRVSLDDYNIIIKTKLELLEIIMMRKCMLGIKQRAESMAVSDNP